MRLKGKKALITGASRGIGRGIAEVFAEEGADVAVNYIESAKPAEDVAKAIQALGRKAIAVKGDVAKRADVEAMIDKAWKELGGLDILVNNAGIETIVPFLELTDEQWTRLVDVNLRGRVAVLAGVLPQARSPKSARAASCTSDRFRRRRCCPAARTTRRRSSGSKR